MKLKIKTKEQVAELLKKQDDLLDKFSKLTGDIYNLSKSNEYNFLKYSKTNKLAFDNLSVYWNNFNKSMEVLEEIKNEILTIDNAIQKYIESDFKSK